MGYHQRVGSGRGSGREHGMRRREKASKEKKRRSVTPYEVEEDHVQTLEQIVDSTIKRLSNLGNQVFAVSPFSQHFDRWLVNLRMVLSEFESNGLMAVDNDFLSVRSQALSNVEFELQKRRAEEVSGDEAVKTLSAKRTLFEQVDKDQFAKMKDAERKNTVKIKSLSSSVDDIKQELDTISEMKTGIFRGVSKKTKARKEAEATERLNAAQKQVTAAEHNFASEQGRIRSEYEKKKQPILEQIRAMEKEVEDQSVDGSLEARKAACETLINAVKASVERKSAKTV